MSLKLYRRSKLGETLVSTLDDMKKNNQITDPLYERILQVFDRVSIIFKVKVVCEEIKKGQKNKCTIKVINTE